MKDSIEILSPISEFQVFQHRDGWAKIHLYGSVSLSEESNYPVVKVIDITNEKLVIYERIMHLNSFWEHDLKLKTGMYRIETGIALKLAGFSKNFIKKGSIIRNVFVGENFLIAGQSNASGYGRQQVVDIPQYGVIMYKDKWEIASHPLGHALNDSVNEDYFNTGHSPWISLGKRILNSLNIPVGLIPVSLSGSFIDDWAQEKPLFENMINKGKETGAKNLIWYQGCSDVFGDLPHKYYKKINNFLSAVKRNLGDTDIYIIQISGTTNDKHPHEGWRVVRDAQRKAAIENRACLITSYDLTGYSDDIHLGSNDNLTLAERVYQKYISKEAEKPIRVQRNGLLEIKFTGVESLDESCADNVLLLDNEGERINNKAQIKDNSIFIKIENTKEPQIVTLPFGRLYENSTIKDSKGNCIPYFYIDCRNAL